MRSATFNLGLLQALYHYNFFKWVDYLSTVSGGGYIGSSLSWFLAQTKGKFPFDSLATDENNSKPLRWLRRHASYLCPGEGLDIWALSAAIIRGVIINLLIIVPVFFMLTYFLSWAILPDPKRIAFWTGISVFTYWTRGDFFFLFSWAGIIVSAILFCLFSFYAIISRFGSISFLKNRKYSVGYGRFLKVSAILLSLIHI